MRHRLQFRTGVRTPVVIVLLVEMGLAGSALAQESFQLSGLVSGSASLSEGDNEPTALPELDPGYELRLGADWYLHPSVRIHADVLARDDRPDRRREQLGLVEGYLELNLRPRAQRFRIKAGAFFLPTSREHVDAFWKNPYTINASALNSWLGEEFRPIGIDLDYYRSGFTIGATAYRGNDAFGSIVAERGWSLHDNVALLDERIDLVPGTITSISPELDGQTGWAARARWSNQATQVQLTIIDNEADGLRYGDILTWETPFRIVSVEHVRGDWTFIAEVGWGVTIARFDSGDVEGEIDASYALISKRFESWRLSGRFDSYGTEFPPDPLAGYQEDRGEALTVAWIWTPPSRFRAGAEISATDHDTRLAFFGEYAFSLGLDRN